MIVAGAIVVFVLCCVVFAVCRGNLRGGCTFGRGVDGRFLL